MDSTSTAEHLRLVHFTLLATCLGLVATLFIGSTDTLDRAITQLQQIQTFQRSWQSQMGSSQDDFPANWIYREAEAAVLKVRKQEGRSGPTYEADARYQDGSKPPYLEPVFKSLTFWLQAEAHVEGTTIPVAVIIDSGEWQVFTKDLIPVHNPALGGSGPKDISEASPILPRDFTLEQFKEFWNLLHRIENVREFEAPYPYGIIYEKRPLEGNYQFVDWFKLRPAVKAASVAGTYKGNSIRAINKKAVPEEPIEETVLPDVESLTDYFSPVDYSAAAPFFSHRNSLERLHLSVPIYEREIPLDLQTELASLAGFQWPTQEFQDSFADLWHETSSIASLKPDNLLSVLRDQRSKQAEPLQLFGVKLRAQELGLWGSVILFGEILYFWLHLNSLCKRITADDKAWQAPWIGLYTGAPARITTIVSGCVVPFLTAGVVSLYATIRGRMLTFSGLVIAASSVLPIVLLSYLVAIKMTELWGRQVPRNLPQAKSPE